MNGMEHKFYIDQLYVRQYEGTPNAIARVHWVCVIKRNGAKVFAPGHTDLAPPSAEAFINIAQLEAQQVLDWVVAQEGGQPWVDAVVAAHEPLMQQAEAALLLEAWHMPLVNPVRFDPTNV